MIRGNNEISNYIVQSLIYLRIITYNVLTIHIDSNCNKSMAMTENYKH